MKQFACVLLSALALLCGCEVAGVKGTGGAGETGGSGFPVPEPPDPTPHGVNIGDNWQFTTTSTVPGIASLAIAGSITHSGSLVSGSVHIAGSNCFDPLGAVGLTGTLTGSDLSLTTTSVAGQVATFTGNISSDTLTAPNFPGRFTGTYVISGGCADGDEGNVTGAVVPSMAGNWAGDLTSDAGDTNRVGVALVQGAATPEGIFGLTGTVWFESGTCFQSGKIISGTFPSGSYVLGESVSLEIETDNGVIVFLGRAKGDGLIRGNYTLVGSACEPTGTAYLSPWEY